MTKKRIQQLQREARILKAFDEAIGAIKMANSLLTIRQSINQNQSKEKITQL